MDEQFEQITIDNFAKSGEDQCDSQEATQEKIELIVSEVFQDSSSLDMIRDKGYKADYLPEEVRKGRSSILDGVISQQQNEQGLILLEDQEISEITQKMVSSRVSLTFDNDDNDTIQCSRHLTNFDREVIDAVSSLAPVTQIMSSSTIYRIIVGKGDDHPVSKSQKQRVEDSMERCANCRVTIDITSEISDVEKPNEEELLFKGAAISFSVIQHKAKRGVNNYYKIYDMPPFFRLAERLGKVVIIPLHLIDTPVSKSDSIISMQSYLFREIDLMKNDSQKMKIISWPDLYELTYKEGKKPSKSENQRTRTSACAILDYWVEQKYIKSYQSNLKENIIAFEV